MAIKFVDKGPEDDKPKPAPVKAAPAEPSVDPVSSDPPAEPETGQFHHAKATPKTRGRKKRG